ncbi:low-density lipoprotein receptor class A domain-containing protein 1 isoform X3 [Elephas maximus indicus]|uniref:low-density lipoprotein receptor class A domain-containing protein 1 isoform X3 n=1 Tax=Elephas maximus indicus TaxID=99487 RepID=UPI002116C2F0|nr:low-density lipoprotein receptor class A domain-containing protein 1 isoform X3 [Elephas maximus indicus]
MNKIFPQGDVNGNVATETKALPGGKGTRACVTPTNRTGFLCHDRKTCIPASGVCDGVRTCVHGEDEDEGLCLGEGFLDLKVEWFWTGVKEGMSRGKSRAHSDVGWGCTGAGKGTRKGDAALWSVCCTPCVHRERTLLSPRLDLFPQKTFSLCPSRHGWEVTPSLETARVARMSHFQIALRQL